MKTLYKSSNSAGFTLVEVLVVLGIMGVLMAIGFASFSDARKNTRDKNRLTDIKQLQLALRLYQENEPSGDNPSGHDSGTEIGAGDALDDALRPFIGTVPRDENVSDSEYGYIYDTAFDCDGTDRIVLYVDRFEKLTSEVNIGSVCSSSHDGGGDEHIIIIE